MKRLDKPASAPTRLADVLYRLFEALNPGNLTKSQRFALACNLIAVLFFLISLFAGLDRGHYFILAAATLGFLIWSYCTNCKS